VHTTHTETQRRQHAWRRRRVLVVSLQLQAKHGKHVLGMANTLAKCKDGDGELDFLGLLLLLPVPSMDGPAAIGTDERRPMSTMCRQTKRRSCTPTLTRLLTCCHAGQSSFSHCVAKEARALPFLQWNNRWRCSRCMQALRTGNLASHSFVRTLLTVTVLKSFS
jgi:hypothetical protein